MAKGLQLTMKIFSIALMVIGEISFATGNIIFQTNRITNHY